jgi:hypothetical protein
VDNARVKLARGSRRCAARPSSRAGSVSGEDRGSSFIVHRFKCWRCVCFLLSTIHYVIIPPKLIDSSYYDRLHPPMEERKHPNLIARVLYYL